MSGMFDRYDCAALQSRSAIPLHHQLTVLLRQKILSGAVAPEQKLPSEKSLTQTFGVSRITVSRAMQTLADQGLVEKRRGTGNFVSPNSAASSVQSESLALMPFLQLPHHWLTRVVLDKPSMALPEVFIPNAPPIPVVVRYVAGYQYAEGRPVAIIERRYLCEDGTLLAATMFQFRPDGLDLELIPEIPAAV